MDNRVIEILLNKLYKMGLLDENEYRGVLESVYKENRETALYHNLVMLEDTNRKVDECINKCERTL